MIGLEEELFESKTMQNDLLEELKKNEERLEDAVNHLDTLCDELNVVKGQLDHLTFRANNAEKLAQTKIYHAKDKDQVDEVLCEYLTTYPERKKL